MKYIRTKDGIYKAAEINGMIIARGGVAFSSEIADVHYPIVFNEKDILNQDDTIEKLCDGYVIEHPINAFKFFYDKEEMEKCLFNTCIRMFDIHELKVFGCIKTDKGLIYVAKMNDKGELELL